MTIRQRLTLQFSLIVGVLLVAFSSAVYYFSAEYRRNEFFTRLEDKAETTARLLVDVEGVDLALLKTITQNSRDLLPEELIVIYDESNTPIFTSRESRLQFICDTLVKNLPPKGQIQRTIDSHQFISFHFPRENSRFVVVAVAYDKYGFSKLSFLQTILILGCLFAVGFTLVLGQLYARQALSPINGLVDQVREISVNNLNRRVQSQNQKDELAKLATEFNQMLDRLEAAFELQRSFVSNASHELRTPLTSLTGEITLALLAKEINEPGKEVLRSLYQEIRNLNRLANGLLDLAQANLDVSEIQVELLRIDELLGACQADLKKSNPNFEIMLGIDEFPEDENQLMLEGNEQLLRSAISNAIENACKYSTPQQAKVTLRFVEDEIEVWIEDRGIGIPDQDMPFIFEPFFRASNSQGIRGHGIGLALTRKIVEIHHGKVVLESKEGEGTILLLRIPCVRRAKMAVLIGAE